MTAPKNPKILLAMGTRPEIIKMAPVYFALKDSGLKPILLHTGQHSDMAESLYRFFGISPDYSIKLERSANHAYDLADLGANILLSVSKTIADVKPDIVLVHGDTSTALMVAIAAFYHKCKIGHVEAGLRSYDEYSPFPEEKNRVLVSKLAHFHFAPTKLAVKNLRAEGVPKKQIYMVGNSIIDAAMLGVSKIAQYRSQSKGSHTDIISKLEKEIIGKKLVLVTLHRRENQNGEIEEVARTVYDLLNKYQDLLVVWSVHPNPKVKEKIYEAFAGLSGEAKGRLNLTAPLDYPTLIWILQKSWLIMTDSGGIQEEAVALKAPVFVLRTVTERPEVIESGAGKLVGTDKNNIEHEFAELYNSPEQHKSMRLVKNPFGNGKTSGKIRNILLGKI